MKKEEHSKKIRCIAFLSPEEGSKWCAVALEMDIWGFGSTAGEAMIDLDELIEIQIEFAVGKKKLEILNHPANEKWFRLWDVLRKIEEEHKQESNPLSFTAQTKSHLSTPLPPLKQAKCYYHKAA